MFQVVYEEQHTTADGLTVWHTHEARVFADDEVDAECKVADRHPNGYGFWAINCKDLEKYPTAPHSRTWYGNY
jgi:phage major head subunit gpT-like protein